MLSTNFNFFLFQTFVGKVIATRFSIVSDVIDFIQNEGKEKNPVDIPTYEKNEKIVGFLFFF